MTTQPNLFQPIREARAQEFLNKYVPVLTPKQQEFPPTSIRNKFSGDCIFISGNVPSSKNSKVWTGRFLVNSKTVTAYKKIAIPQFRAKRQEFRDMAEGKELPLHVEFTFVRDSKRLFDFVNMAQIVLDLMQECGWVEDDNYLNVCPSFCPEVKIDKANCGVIIKIL